MPKPQLFKQKHTFFALKHFWTTEPYFFAYSSIPLIMNMTMRQMCTSSGTVVALVFLEVALCLDPKKHSNYLFIPCEWVLQLQCHSLESIIVDDQWTDFNHLPMPMTSTKNDGPIGWSIGKPMDQSSTNPQANWSAQSSPLIISMAKFFNSFSSMGSLKSGTLGNLRTFFPWWYCWSSFPVEDICTVFENHRKSLIQQCERSELHLHFDWKKGH